MKELLVKLGLAALARPVLGGRGAILVLHRIREPDPELIFDANQRNSISSGHFEQLLDTIAAAGIEVVSLDEALARIAAPRSRRFVSLTFDDGYRDNHDELFPILEARRVPATIYVAPGLIDGSAPLWWYALDETIKRERRLTLPLPAEMELATDDAAAKKRAFTVVANAILSASAETRAVILAALVDRYGMDAQSLAARHMMNWTMLRRLAASPFVTIGAHTINHPPLATLDIETATAEMAGSRERLERETGLPVRHIAFPFGVPGTIGEREGRLAAKLGFTTAVTGAPGNLFARHAAQRHAWPRHGIGPADGPASFKLKLAGVRNPMQYSKPDR